MQLAASTGIAGSAPVMQPGMSVASLKVATHRAMKNLRKMFMTPGNDK